MNGYLFWVNGVLAAPGFFDVRSANSATLGRLLYLTVDADRLKALPKSIDAFEVRSANIVARYRYDDPEEDKKKPQMQKLVKDEKNEHERLVFPCPRVVNVNF